MLLAIVSIQMLLISLVCLVIFTIFLAVYLQPQPVMRLISKWQPTIFWYKDTDQKILALTIDDAPTKSTNQILDILAKYECKATFFIISNYAKKYPEIMKRIKDEGHEMGNHLIADEPSWKLSSSEFERHLLECDETLTSFGAFENRTRPYKWMRPGSGFFTENMKKICEKLGYKIALGNVYPHDPQVPIAWINARFVVNRARPGSIVIIHDRSWTIPALENILLHLKQKEKFQFVTLSELDSM